MKRENNLNIFLTGALSLLLGVILVAATDEVLTVFNYIFVCIFGIIGVIQIISFIINKGYLEGAYNNLFIGVVFIWLALIMYVYYMMIINILPIIFSLYLFIMGIYLFIKYGDIKKNSNTKNWSYITMGIISVIVGILLIFEPKFGVYTYLKITGINIILISMLFFITLVKNIRNKKND